MAEEIIFSDYQAEVFNEAENLLRTQGYLGEQLFEDTYVLQKRLADWIIDAVPVNGSASSLMSEATNAYNGVLGIATDEAPAPVVVAVQSEPIKPKPPVSIRPTPSFGVTAIRPMTPVKPKIQTSVASPAPKPVVSKPKPTSLTRPASTANTLLNVLGNSGPLGTRNLGTMFGRGGRGGFGNDLF